MKSSFLPGCAHMYAYSARRFASCCQRSPGIFESSEPLPCTTSSCESGRMKFSFHAYTIENVSSWWWYCRWIGCFWKYESVSCIQPMFHLKPKPSPPRYVGRETPGHAVDSSAELITPGSRPYSVSFISFRNETESRSSLPPNMFGTHSPALRE